MNFFDNLMAPLGIEHCMILYYLGIFTFIFALLYLLSGFIKVFDKKSRDMGIVLIFSSFFGFFSYYLYRIVYSMCVKSM
mgnify:CR=1 FL=1